MTKKRKFHFIYSNNTKEEEYIIRKEFNEMLRDVIFKKGQSFAELIALITIITTITVITLKEFNIIIKTISIIVLTIILLLFIHKIYKQWKK